MEASEAFTICWMLLETHPTSSTKNCVIGSAAITINMSWLTRRRVSHRRQLQASLSLQIFKQLPAFLVFQSSARPLPLQQLTDRAAVSVTAKPS